ncbi:MAG TPA: BrnT family toxin [Chthoniobacterales bacterium]
MKFEWDSAKAHSNKQKHGISFNEAIKCFADEKAVVILDEKHSSQKELRFYLIGKGDLGRILTIRYTHRGQTIRLIGAGAWRGGRDLYNQINAQ